MSIIKIVGFILALIGIWTVWVLWKDRSEKTMVTREVPLEKLIDPQNGNKEEDKKEEDEKKFP